ncbi:ciliary microtubule-associated protein 3 isoform X2 [Dasypus novemcinctus]|uniref:ciliary microtubule-associated protein 3 isoform X2 n=1 Tax=Dasypus novemcinctus TaxID=9361 RepID=UPI00265DCA90|nr:protein pitchfork isoform X2 [Dasypus novemcinctus]
MEMVNEKNRLIDPIEYLLQSRIQKSTKLMLPGLLTGNIKTNRNTLLTREITQPFLWEFTHETLIDCPFGTCQQRKLFPNYRPTSLLGNKFLPLRGAPNRGPGCYITEDDITPYTGMYQKIKPTEEKHIKSFAPFNVLIPRFGKYTKDTYPGPGTYNPEINPPRKVVWPMKFGSPDWAQVPCLQKRTLKAELSTDKDFRKHRNRVAYLSLYYN